MSRNYSNAICEIYGIHKDLMRVEKYRRAPDFVTLDKRLSPRPVHNLGLSTYLSSFSHRFKLLFIFFVRFLGTSTAAEYKKKMHNNYKRGAQGM